MDARFADRLEQAVAQADRTDETIAVHMLAIGNRRSQAEVIGHLKTLVRQCDAFADWSDGSFVILQRAAARYEGVVALSRKLLAVAGELELEATVGVSLHSRGVGPEQLLSRAAQALSEALECESHFRCYREEEGEAVPSMLLNERLHGAFERGEFLLHYQPLLRLADDRTVGFEALLRWQHPRRGMVDPGAFISMAERSGLIVELGSWVLEEACRSCRRWNDRVEDPLSVAVNVSAVQLEHPGFSAAVIQALEGCHLPAHLLELELTETISMDSSPAVRETLRGLRERGVRLSLDDFGTGYSSLRSLSLLPIDRVKIPIDFVERMPEEVAGPSMVEVITGMARQLNLQVVAEGVETEDQLAALRAIGCHLAQGFHLGRPNAEVELG